MNAEELNRIIDQADFAVQEAFANQIWTANEDGTITIQDTSGAEPVVLQIEEEDDKEEDEESIPECSGSSTAVDPSASDESTISLESMDAHLDLLMPEDFDEAEADNRPSASIAYSAPASPGADLSSPSSTDTVDSHSSSHHRSHSSAYHPYARPSYRTRATVSANVETESRNGGQ